MEFRRVLFRALEGAGRKQDLVSAALGEVRIAWFARTAAPSLELVPVTPIEHVQHVGTHPEAEVTARVPALFKCNVELLVADASLRLERIVEDRKKRRVGKECVSTGRSRWSPSH